MCLFLPPSLPSTENQWKRVLARGLAKQTDRKENHHNKRYLQKPPTSGRTEGTMEYLQPPTGQPGKLRLATGPDESLLGSPRVGLPGHRCLSCC